MVDMKRSLKEYNEVRTHPTERDMIFFGLVSRHAVPTFWLELYASAVCVFARSPACRSGVVFGVQEDE